MAEKPKFLDGKSFFPLLVNSKENDEATWREPIVIENWQAKRNRGKVLPGAYSGLRFYDQVYVEWVTGDKEFYDLANDPFELENVYDSLSIQQQTELKQRLCSSRNVEMNPLVTIIPAPIETSQLQQPNFLSGYAEDDASVTGIELTIQELSTKLFWDGRAWSSNRVVVAAKMSSSNQQMVAWTYQRTGELEIEKLRLEVSAIARDNTGNESTTVRQQILPSSDGK